ncbi:MAG: TonB-dependent receptor [Kiritimatiellia bacterium]
MKYVNGIQYALVLTSVLLSNMLSASTNDTIVVTAAALPKYRAETTDAGMLLEMPPQESPFTVDSLTADFIRERNPTDLDQLLALQPGIYQGGKTVMARNAGAYTIRGFSGNEVLLGGVPLTGGIGTFLDPSLLERVDIVKGPVGGAYGSQSNSMSDVSGAGGTIILQPKRPDFTQSFRDFTVRGSYSRGSGSRLKFMSDINQVVAEENFAVRVPLSMEWREPGYALSAAGVGRTYSIAPSLTLRLEERLEIGADLFYQYSNQPAHQGIRTAFGKPVNGDSWDSTYAEAGDRMQFMTHGGAFRVEGKVNDWLSLRTRASMFQTENRYHYRGPNSSPRFSPKALYEYGAGDRLTRAWYAGQEAVLTFDSSEVKHQLIIGANITMKQSQGKGSFGSSPIDLGKVASSQEEQKKIGLTAQELAQWRGVSLMMGLRADWHDSVKHEHAWTYSPRLGLSYDVAEAGWAILFANVSLTDTPNFNQKKWTKSGQQGSSSTDYLSGTWRAIQKEAGIRVNPVESLWISTTYFHIDQSNAPVAVTDTIDPDLTAYVEDGKTNSQGIELSASGNITENWSLFLAYTYIDYYDKTRGLRFDRFPPHALSFWTSYKASWLGGTVLGFGGRWRDNWLMTFRGQPAGERYAVKSLLTFDASAELPFGDNVSCILTVRNLFESRGIESARNLQAFANDGRTFELSFHVRF